MINDFESQLEEMGEVGSVEGVKSSVIKISGLPGAFVGERILTEGGVLGWVFSVERNHIVALKLSQGVLEIGEKVVRSGKPYEVAIGDFLLGGVVDPLGGQMGGRMHVGTDISYKEMDIDAPGFAGRAQVVDFMETGSSIVDLVIPIGKGQRELVIGDRKTGKSAFALQTVVSQAKRGTVCVYGLIGKRGTYIKGVSSYLDEADVLDKVAVISTMSSDPVGLIYLVPYFAMTVAEYFRDSGKDVLVVLDDLTTHAKFYREVSLVAGRFPGRDSYPGDIFYTHARLLERAGNFDKGSITCLPMAESVEGDLSGYIQTNLMSITDGHLFFDSVLYNQGKRPPVNPFLSVTRVGRQTQGAIAKDLGRSVTTFMTELRRLRDLMHFGAELNESVKAKLALGDRLEVLFYKFQGRAVSLEFTIFIVSALWIGWYKDQDLISLEKKIGELIDKYDSDKAFSEEVCKIVGDESSFEVVLRKVQDNLSLLS